MNSDSKFISRLSLFVIIYFVLVSCLHFFSFRPLWLDENLLFNNLEFLSLGQMFGPFKHAQAFPRVYFVLVKFLAESLNYSVAVLRFVPFCAMVAAFFMWKKVYQVSCGLLKESLFMAFMFAVSFRMVYYAAEFKQYSMDVLVASVFCLYLLKQEELTSDRKYVLLTLLLPFTFVFSYSAIFFMPIVLYNFLFLSERKNMKLLFLVYMVLSILVLAFVYYFDIRHGMEQSALFVYWQDYFIGCSSLGDFFKPLSEGIRNITAWWFGNTATFKRLASVFIPFFLVGLFAEPVSQLRQRKYAISSLGSIGAVVFCELFFLAILKKYPFTGERLTLFFAPIVFYCIVKGVSLCKRNKIIYCVMNVYLCCFLLVCGINTFWAMLTLY